MPFDDIDATTYVFREQRGGKEDFTYERRVLPASQLKDRVRNENGENLGRTEDVAIDLPSGRIAYAVLSFGGFLGVGNKLFAVPWEALTFHQRDREAILNVDRRQLEEAPGFDKDDWPDMADREWGERVFRHYCCKPYWESAERPPEEIEREKPLDRTALANRELSTPQDSEPPSSGA